MISDYSPSYKAGLKREKDRYDPDRKMPISDLFWKLSGIIVILTTLIGLAGSCWFSWKIRSGLDDLSKEQGRKQELRQASLVLQGEADKLLVRDRIETVAAKDLALYPSTEKYIGDGITVRIPSP